MTKRNWIAVALILLSFSVLIPGLTLNIISIKVSVGGFILLDKSQSILSSIESLYDSKDYLVAGLILLFSVIVPFTKGTLLLLVFFLKNKILRWRIFYVIYRIGKWSMADVFVVGIYISFLATKATQNMDAQTQPGFFFFLAYCLISLAAMDIMTVENPKEKITKV